VLKASASQCEEANSCLSTNNTEEKGIFMKSFEKIDNIRDIRKKLGLNQMDFWSRIGVTQSGGSRYESGRNMPKPVRELLRLVHIERVDLAKVNRDDLAIASLLKNRDPELYASLKKEAKSDKGK
jgi:transcriptional regulator, XRE family